MVRELCIHARHVSERDTDLRAKAGAQAQFTALLSGGFDARYIGQQWLRGDEANETAPLDSYALANATLGVTMRNWEIRGIVTNLFDSRRATFGTLNVNHRTGDLERFLSPVGARGFTIVLRRDIALIKAS